MNQLFNSRELPPQLPSYHELCLYATVDALRSEVLMLRSELSNRIVGCWSGPQNTNIPTRLEYWQQGLGTKTLAAYGALATDMERAEFLRMIRPMDAIGSLDQQYHIELDSVIHGDLLKALEKVHDYEIPTMTPAEILESGVPLGYVAHLGSEQDVEAHLLFDLGLEHRIFAEVVTSAGRWKTNVLHWYHPVEERWVEYTRWNGGQALNVAFVQKLRERLNLEPIDNDTIVKIKNILNNILDYESNNSDEEVVQYRGFAAIAQMRKTLDAIKNGELKNTSVRDVTLALGEGTLFFENNNEYHNQLCLSHRGTILKLPYACNIYKTLMSERGRNTAKLSGSLNVGTLASTRDYLIEMFGPLI